VHVGAAEDRHIAPWAPALPLLLNHGRHEPLIGRLVSGFAGGRNDGYLGETAVRMFRRFRRLLQVDFVRTVEECGDQVVEELDKERC